MLFHYILAGFVALVIISYSGTHIKNTDISPPVQIPVEGVEVLVRTCGPARSRTFIAAKNLEPEFCYNHYRTVQEAALALYPGTIVGQIERQVVRGEIYYFVYLTKREE